MRTRVDRTRTVVAFPASMQEIGAKPNGLWYELDQDWRRWCDSEQPNWLKGRFVHQVSLGKTRLRIIRTLAEFDAFTLLYGTNVRGYVLIDWPRLVDECDGIEIAPYLNERRFGSWYYPWDCASGCVWRLRGVRFKLIEELPGTQESTRKSSLVVVTQEDKHDDLAGRGQRTHE